MKKKCIFAADKKRRKMNTNTTNSESQLVATGSGSVAEMVATFADAQDVKRSSRDIYRRAVLLFFDWVAQSGRLISALTAADLIQYKEELLTAGRSALTIGGYVNALRRFYAWAEANKLYPNIAASVHAPRRKNEFRKQPLSVAKVGELLTYEKEQSARDYAIVNLMVRTGLRCIEVARANVGDITFIGCDNTRVLMVQGKGRDEKDNFVILTSAAWEPIREYLDRERKGAADIEPLFTCKSNHAADGGRLTTRTISAIAKSGLKSVGLDNKAFTAHSLRHTAGTNILRAGGTLEQAQQTLRHANPATTEIYARMALTERRFSNGGETLLDELYSRVTNN